MCDYIGHDFGASYPDSVCIDGRLFDADNCDNNGNLYEPCEYKICPECCHEEWLADQQEEIEGDGYCASADGLKLEDNPFPKAATRYPKDGETYRIWWKKGWHSYHEEGESSASVKSESE